MDKAVEDQGVAAMPPGHSGSAPSPVPGLGHPASVPNADREAEAAAKLGERYRRIQSEQYACSEIVCVFPHDGNCWCFNTALAQHVEQAIEDADESCKHGHANWRDCGTCTLRANIAAQAIEARRATTGTGVVHESAVAESDAPKVSHP